MKKRPIRSHLVEAGEQEWSVREFVRAGLLGLNQRRHQLASLASFVEALHRQEPSAADVGEDFVPAFGTTASESALPNATSNSQPTSSPEGCPAAANYKPDPSD